jgi:hypothetical protein
MRLIRHRAAEFGIAGGPIATLGFSAGGHLCATLAAYHAPLDGEGVDEVDAENEEARRKESTKKFQERFSSGDDMALNMAVKMFMVGAIGELRTLPVENVKHIAAEIALLGMKGISPDKKSGYSVPSLDSRDMSGCQMLAYYYVSWKFAFPDAVHKIGLPFENEYAEALAMAEAGL